MMSLSSFDIREILASSRASQVVQVVKNPPVNAADLRAVGAMPGSGRPP